MKGITLQDLYRYEGVKSNTLGTQLRYLLFTPGYQFTYCFRKASSARNILTRLFWRLLHRGCMFHTGIQIPVGTSIGAGFRIAHFGGIVINPEAKIGRNFTIAQGVLIGNAEGKKRGTPVIGDNVVIGANAIVIGGITIGNNTLIAPGAFVNFDVPSDSIVIGNPGKIIPAEKPTGKYIVYSIPD